MDPEETLRQLRLLTESVNSSADEANRAEVATADLTEEAENFATLFGALDEWLAGGGFLPASWRG